MDEFGQVIISPLNIVCDLFAVPMAESIMGLVIILAIITGAFFLGFALRGILDDAD